MKVPCPNCKKEMIWSTENSYRPFCSQRCKLIDLGEWFEEKNMLSSNLTIEDNEEY